MPEILVDLFSDTMTRPSPAMRQAMASAEVGDEQRFEDPTVNRLQSMVADLLGKKAALFLPSGTMCNEIALAVLCRDGEEVILDETAHPLTSEAGGPAVLARAVMRPLHGERGVFTEDQVRSSLRIPSRYAPKSAVLSVEQTSNMGGGTVWPLERIAGVCAMAHEAGMVTHCDGARLLNAVVASGIPAQAYAGHFDSIWIDLSKGLGAPVGAVLAGSADFIERAWRWKQRIGGAMRQAGIIAAGGIYALENNVDRLAEDHANARALAEGIAGLPGVGLDPRHVETNIVIFELDPKVMTPPALADVTLERHGVRLCPISATRVRAVTHLDVTRSDVDAAIEALTSVLGR